METLYKLINKCIFEKKEKPSQLLRKFKTICPLIVDFDFKYKKNW